MAKEDGKGNEILCKILCHNICVVMQEIHEFRMQAEF